MGTLKGGTRQRFEDLLHDRPDLQARVQTWESRLLEVMGFAPPVPPPPRVWQRLEQRLFPDTASIPRWFKRLAIWRNLAMGSGLLAGVLALMLFTIPVPEAPGYVALISNPSQQSLWMVSSSSKWERFHIKNIEPVDVPPGKRCFLWLKPENSEKVYALGALPEKGESITLAISRELRDAMMPGQLLVTLEDMAVSPPREPSDVLEFRGKWIPLEGA